MSLPPSGLTTAFRRSLSRPDCLPAGGLAPCTADSRKAGPLLLRSCIKVRWHPQLAFLEKELSVHRDLKLGCTRRTAGRHLTNCLLLCFEPAGRGVGCPGKSHRHTLGQRVVGECVARDLHRQQLIEVRRGHDQMSQEELPSLAEKQVFQACGSLGLGVEFPKVHDPLHADLNVTEDDALAVWAWLF